MFGKIKDIIEQGVDKAVAKVKSPMMRKELIKTIQGIDVKELCSPVKTVLDIHLNDEDLKVVLQEITNFLERCKAELLKK